MDTALKEKRTFRLTPDMKRTFVSVFVCLAFLIAIGFLNPRVMSFSRVSVITNAQMALIFAGIGQTLVLLIGNIDLSVGGIICITNSLAALYMPDSWFGVVICLIWSVALGAAIGAFNGVIVTRFKVQPFVVTFTVNYILLGIALYLLPLDGGNVPSRFVSLLINKIGGVIPVSLILIIILIACWIYFRRTKLARSMYAVGCNERACRAIGIDVGKVRILTYAICGAFCGLAGYWRTAQMSSGSPTAGDALTMQTLTICVIGGTSMAGGRGGIVGTIIGSVILRLMADMLTFAQAKTYWSTIFSGLFLVLTVIVGAIIDMRGGRDK